MSHRANTSRSATVLLDIGNSSINWACVQDSGLDSRPAIYYRLDLLADQLQAAWAGLPPPDRVVIANVGGADVERGVRAWVDQHWQCPTQLQSVVTPAFDLTIAYQQPERLGVDRWLAMLAARQQHAGAVCVVSCGSAVTVDAVSDDGRHLGGWIAPGLAMMRRALTQQTHGVTAAPPAVSPQTPGLGLADNTAAAMQAGTLHTVGGFIDRTRALVVAELAATPQWLLTGGDAATLQPLLSEPWHYVPDLVLQGLAVTIGMTK